MTTQSECLRSMELNPMVEFTAVSLAGQMGVNTSTVSSALARGYASCADGWQFIHRSTKRRPAFYWCDPAADRSPQPVEPDPTGEVLRIIVQEGGKLLLHRDYDGSLWIAERFHLEAEIDS